MVKSLRSRDNPHLAAEVAKELERPKWSLWPGDVFRALQLVEDLEMTLDVDGAGLERRKLLNTVTEFGGDIRANANCMPKYGEGYRSGEVISSAFVESTVNQVVSKRMVTKQQMRWTPQGAHLLLQVRTGVLKDELTGVFRQWYPAFAAPTQPPDRERLAASAPPVLFTLGHRQ